MKYLLISTIGLLILLSYCNKKDNKRLAKSDHRIMSLAMIIQAEGSNVDSTEKALIGATVMFRLCNPEFRDTDDNIDSIIQKKMQYQGYINSQYCYNEKSYIIAKRLISLESEFNKVYNGGKSDMLNTSIIYYMWLKTLKKPHFVKKIVYRQKYHNFGI